MTLQWWCAAVGTPWEWSWRPYPGVWLFIASLGALGLWVHRRADAVDSGTGDAGPHQSDDGEAGVEPAGPFRQGKPGVGLMGLLILWIALDWPVGALGGGYLASVHMVQFLLIALVAPPFLLLGLPPSTTRVLVRASGPILPLLTRPLVAMGVFVVLMSWTHWPPVVDAMMASQLGSFALDLIWLWSGVVFWWPVVVPHPHRSWFGYPARLGYLVVATLVNTGVFVFLTYSELPVYATYELAPPIPGLTTRTDQTLAGLVMKMGGAIVLWCWITALFVGWYRTSEREA